MKNSIVDCEHRIQKLLDRRYCILTGRGATALWMAYQLVDQHRPRVLMPSMMCLSPLFTALMVNREPVFCDVLKTNATLDPDEVQRILDRDETIGAVLLVHLFGNAAQIEKVAKICKSKNVLLIEDAAQSLGGKTKAGDLLGSRGHISILSFGHTKILDMGSGGAFLTDDDHLAQRARTLLETIRSPKRDYEIVGSTYKTFYYSICEAAQYDVRRYELFDAFPQLFGDLYLTQPNEDMAKKILIGLDGLDEEVQKRVKRVLLYRDKIERIDGVQSLMDEDSGVPWRYSFRVDASRRNSLLNKIRGEGFDASSWYPCMSQWNAFGRQDKSLRLPVATQLSREVVNLWVGEGYTDQKIKAVARIIQTELNQDPVTV